MFRILNVFRFVSFATLNLDQKVFFLSCRKVDFDFISFAHSFFITINAPKYDHMTISTVIGVLEMTKLHYWNVSEQDNT